jgi:hypothetical protein
MARSTLRRELTLAIVFKIAAIFMLFVFSSVRRIACM